MLSVAIPHPNIQCDRCLQHIAGRRFKCVNCADFDCCEACLIADPVCCALRALCGVLCGAVCTRSDLTGVMCRVRCGVLCVAAALQLYSHYFDRTQLLSRPIALPNPGAVPSDANPTHSGHTHLFLAVHTPLPPAVSHNPLFWSRPTHYLTPSGSTNANATAALSVSVPVSVPARNKSKLPAHAATCDGCNQPVIGIRYKCSVCAGPLRGACVVCDCN